MSRWNNAHESEYMTSPYPVTADPTAGKHLLGSTDVLTIDPDQLRSLSSKLENLADSFAALSTEAEGLRGKIASEAARFTRSNQPAPIYADTVEGLAHTGDKYRDELKKLSDQLRYDAGGLLWIADQHESNEADAKSSFEDIDADVYTI